MPKSVLIASIAVGLAGSVFGYRLDRGRGKVPPPAPISKITLILIAFDTQGREIRVGLTGPSPSIVPQMLGLGCRFTHPEGTTLRLRFKPSDVAAYGPEREESVTWRSEQAYRRWLDNDLRDQLARMNSHFNGKAWDDLIERRFKQRTSQTYEYPILFRSER